MSFKTSVKTIAPVLTLALGLALVAQVAVAGSVTGKITYDDKVPTFKPVDMNADPVCASKHSSPVYPEILVLGDDGGLANVFVQVKNAPSGGAAGSDPVVIDQNGCRYEPHVVGVMVGQTVKFKNSDGILHNVHGLPKENREFNIGMPPTLLEKDQVFNKPEAHFPVKCDVHPWMKTYIAVMTHPYFAVSGSDGTFEISGLPAGSYEIEAWHEKLGTQTATVTVGDGAASADFSFKVPGK
jgi:plastocyanin